MSRVHPRATVMQAANFDCRLLFKLLRNNVRLISSKDKGLPAKFLDLSMKSSRLKISSNHSTIIIATCSMEKKKRKYNIFCNMIFTEKVNH